MDDGRAAIETPRPSAPHPQGRRPIPRRILVLVPPLLTLVVGAVVLTRGHGLWYDELFSTEVARRPLSEIVRAAWEGRGTTWYLRDVPPSYNLPWYVVAHAVLGLPGTDGDLALRVFSLACAATATGVIAAAVSRLAHDRRIGMAAGVVTALNPLVIEWGVEARSHGLALLATAGTVLGWAPTGSGSATSSRRARSSVTAVNAGPPGASRFRASGRPSPRHRHCAASYLLTRQVHAGR